MALQINPDRPLFVGPDVPEAPFPHKISGKVVSGFGRGSKELGIPTGMSIKVVTLQKHLQGTPLANLSDEALEAMCTEFTSGVYYGWAQIGAAGSQVYPMVMSLGWNPYYKNEKRSGVSIEFMVWNQVIDVVLLLGSAYYP